MARPGARGARRVAACAAFAVVAVALGCGPQPGAPGGGQAPSASGGAVASGPAAGGAPAEPAPSPGDSRRPGTIKMAARLDYLTRNLDPTKNAFANIERAAIVRATLATTTNAHERRALTMGLADQLLKAGNTQEALDTVLPLLKPDPKAMNDPTDAEVKELIGLCYLRMGEQENCIGHHGVESCLLPIKGSGVHVAQRGSREAIKWYKQILADNPADLSTRWLMNIAAMTVGDYPAKVPPGQLIPPKTFDSEHDIKRFTDVAPRAGLAIVSHAGGGIMEDFDGDGFLDIMASSMGLRDQLHLFHNNGDGTFTERSEAAGLTGEFGGLNIVHADYDNDGHPDVLVLRGGWMQKGGVYPKSLLRNLGDGTFEDVTEKAGILTAHPTQTGSWADYDGDGWLDLFVGNEALPGDPHPCELYHNNRDGTFTDRTADIGEPILGYVKGVVWGDFNNDGRPDLYVSILDHDNKLYRNDGSRVPPGPRGEDWRFTDVSPQAGTVAPKESFPTWFWDYDNDGWLDIMAAGFKDTNVADLAKLYLGMPVETTMPKLYHNNHDGTFSDVAHAVRLDRVALPMGSNFGDLDNDGWPDCYFGDGEPSLRALIPNRMFRNEGGRVFEDVTTSGGFGHLQKGHGVAFGDIDNDGDQDIFEVMGGWFEGDFAFNVLYTNPGHGNHWATLRLEGRRSNRSAIGARIKVTVATPRGGRDIYASVTSGGSFGGSSLQQEIGLGNATAIQAIEVRWPTTGEVQVFRDVKMDRFYHLVEGEPQLAPEPRRRFTF